MESPILEPYYEIIGKEFPDCKEFGISFFPDVENYCDSIEPIKDYNINNHDINYPTIYHELKSPTIITYYDYSFETSSTNKIFSEVNRCFLNGKKFLKIITSYNIKEESYDFILAPNNEILNIIKELKDKKDLQLNANIHIPLIDIPFDFFNKEIFEFLLNKEFDTFCKQYNIKKKRAYIFSGPPGNGKSISISHIKNEAQQKNINTIIYNSAQEFMDSYSDLYDNKNKKIVILEEFDTYAQERVKDNYNGKTLDSNPVLNLLLNLLDGINEITNTVFLFTTNHVQSLDKAFIRPGRIDQIITFNYPTIDQKKKFLEIYLKEYDSHAIINYLQTKNVSVSYAILKGITDKIRIKEFWNKQEGLTIKLGIEEIFDIITKVLSNSNNLEEVKDLENYTL